MIVKVRTFARYKEIFGSAFPIELETEAVIPDLVMKICEGDAVKKEALCGNGGSLRGHIIVAVNGSRVEREDVESFVLKEGDEVALFPPVSGG